MARRAVTGALLVGGASTRFGSPKALAEFGGETLAERAHRTLREAFGRVIAVGKAADGLPLPFPVFDDGSDVRAPIVGVAAALRLARTDAVVCLPVDVPGVTPTFLRALADALEDAPAAHPETGPLPAAFRRDALPLLERRISAGDLALHRATRELGARIVPGTPELLRNVNTPEALAEMTG
ncbi:MAG: molybdenum cofactor guanylyltransferase [Actinomycetota bacterium]|nr:molybdenum cofactor guanylyltransferase [Actinomycetota bacterium]